MFFSHAESATVRFPIPGRLERRERGKGVDFFCTTILKSDEPTKKGKPTYTCVLVNFNCYYFM